MSEAIKTIDLWTPPVRDIERIFGPARRIRVPRPTTSTYRIVEILEEESPRQLLPPDFSDEDFTLEVFQGVETSREAPSLEYLEGDIRLFMGDSSLAIPTSLSRELLTTGTTLAKNAVQRGILLTGFVIGAALSVKDTIHEYRQKNKSIGRRSAWTLAKA